MEIDTPATPPGNESNTACKKESPAAPQFGTPDNRMVVTPAMEAVQAAHQSATSAEEAEESSSDRNAVDRPAGTPPVGDMGAAILAAAPQLDSSSLHSPLP